MQWGVSLAVGSLVGVSLLTGSALARSSATADLSIKFVTGSQPKEPLVGQSFLLQAGMVNNGPDPGNARVNFRLPSELRRVAGTYDCTGAAPILNCDELTAKVGDDGAGTVVLIADAPGTYSISVFLDRLDATDPTTADDTDTLTVTVRPAAPALAAGAVSIAPAHPRAGSTVVIAFGLTDPTAGSTVAATAARCTASFGNVRARVVSGRPTCTVKTPSARRGAVLRGRLTATARGKQYVRKFAVRLR